MNYTIDMACEYLKVGRTHIHQLARDGRLHRWHDGIGYLITFESLERYRAERDFAVSTKGRQQYARTGERPPNPKACPRCGILTDGGLCDDCHREEAGEYRWYEAVSLRSCWGEGRVRA